MKHSLVHAVAILVLVAATASPAVAQTLDANLKILEPLANKTWVGELSAPDGSARWKTIQKYEVLPGGHVVKLTRKTPDIGSHEEGYFYWDREEGKVAVFLINQKGIVQRGLVTKDGDRLTIAGRISFPERTFDYRNTFELTSAGTMTDRWFQNAFGDWRPGHVVELTVRKD